MKLKKEHEKYSEGNNVPFNFFFSSTQKFNSFFFHLPLSALIMLHKVAALSLSVVAWSGLENRERELS